MKSLPFKFDDPIETAFQIYHQNNPNIYRSFRAYSMRAIRSGRKFGAKAIFEIMRWQTGVRSNTDEFKINNTFISYYVRLFELDHPEHTKYFKKRVLKNERRKKNG